MMRNILMLLFLFLLISSCYYDNVDEMHPEVGLVPDCDDDTTFVTYNNYIRSLLARNCGSGDNSCHGANAGNGYPLDTYDNVSAFVSTGQLLGCIIHDPAYFPMPYPDGKLSDCKINKVKAWINQGIVEQ